MSVWLMQCHPDMRRVASYAARHGMASGEDLGYAIHALLAAAFGDRAPRQFRLFDDGRGLLAYSDHPPDMLSQLAVFALPEVAAALSLETLLGRPMPEAWIEGLVLDFEVRARPVRRHPDGHERDILTVAVERAQALSEPLPSREDVYREWLVGRLDGAAEILGARLVGWRTSVVQRKTQAVAGGTRRLIGFRGPDALFQGTLRIVDALSWRRVLERGIGRHRAFGFGMLLVKPSR